jgi:hypothetical protein
MVDFNDAKKLQQQAHDKGWDAKAEAAMKNKFGQDKGDQPQQSQQDEGQQQNQQ